MRVELKLPGLREEIARRAPEWAVPDAAADPRPAELSDAACVLPAADLLPPGAPEELAVWIACEANRRVAAFAAASGGRVVGCGIVPTAYAEHAMLDCLEDAVLGRGLGAVVIDGSLDDVRLAGFRARAEAFGVEVIPVVERAQRDETPLFGPDDVSSAALRASAGRPGFEGVAA